MSEDRICAWCKVESDVTLNDKDLCIPCENADSDFRTTAQCTACKYTGQMVEDNDGLCGCDLYGEDDSDTDYSKHTCQDGDEDCYECLQEWRRNRYGDSIHNTDCVCNSCRGVEYRGADY
jgi:hypothetical protein